MINLYCVFIDVYVKTECRLEIQSKICPTLQLRAEKYFHSITVFASFFLRDQRRRAVLNSVPFQFQRGQNDFGWSKPGTLFRYERPLQLHKWNRFLSGAFFSSYHKLSLMQFCGSECNSESFSKALLCVMHVQPVASQKKSAADVLVFTLKDLSNDLSVESPKQSIK